LPDREDSVFLLERTKGASCIGIKIPVCFQNFSEYTKIPCWKNAKFINFKPDNISITGLCRLMGYSVEGKASGDA
jgi:hypothetical protein